MPDGSDPRFFAALEHFKGARQRATLEMLSARLTGKPTELLPFHEVRRRLKAPESGGVSELRSIPIDAIVGSVGRYSDFTRAFLPRNESDSERWAAVSLAFSSPKGVPPIHVYQVGDVYFVLDGNHRVSVARSLGLDEIQAYVTPIKSTLPLTPETGLDDLIIMEEQAEFLEQTGLDDTQPQEEFRMTVPGRYSLLLDSIGAHQVTMEERDGRKVPTEEAAQRWVSEVYRPAVSLIRERGILRNFPGRTAADLFAWLAQHHEKLSQTVGWRVKPEAALDDFVARYSQRPRRMARRLGQKIRKAVVPTTITAGPPPGTWRGDRQPAAVGRLFPDVLVPVSGEEQGWRALEQALVIAAKEDSNIHGIYVAREAIAAEREQALKAQFHARCTQVGRSCELHIHVGSAISEVIRDVGHWADLMVLRLAHPPGSLPVDRLRSGFSTLIRTASRPILAVPREVSPLARPLLAYDDSPKAREALYVATYLSGCWRLPLAVVTVSDERRPGAAARARTYLEEQGIEAEIIEVRRKYRSVAQHILETAWARESDLVIMGGYGFNPALEIALGSVVDAVLQHSEVPILICR